MKLYPVIQALLLGTTSVYGQIDLSAIDNTSQNGGIFKVFKQEGGKLKRIGTADENLNIFKK